MFLGDNFLGVVYRATCSTEDESLKTNLFVKIAPEDEGKRNLMRLHDCFMRERYVYEVVTARYSNLFLLWHFNGKASTFS